ncbi:Surfeit locus protein [Penicillium oxalicum]|uniref:Surfeit locus protein n=1 Tax=Penicillium oxalicum TaxID=69781 RepID=UPI0020B68763|nr:Surfeit locus protein [Penicillium oxalicum]KAI2790951.1 Surfeit locus protein [Penicillium oxalicum]
MAQIRGTAGYNLGHQNPFGGPSSADATSDPSPLDAIREQTSKIEDWLDSLADPVKPYLPAIGRFLIVVTFIEDSLRILTQWSDQLVYLRDFGRFPWGITHMFLIINVIAMSVCSFLVIARKRTEYAVAGLLGVVITKVLDMLDEKDRKMYVQFAGRVLLIFLFIGFVFSGSWSFWRIVVSLFGLVACVMVIVGFKAKWSATILVVLLSVFNVLVNNFWTLHPHHPHKDFAKYDFFQILSIVGGLLLLVNMGPGQLSMDEKKKVY